MIFNRGWFLLTLVVSFYFSFVTYPKIYEKLTGTRTPLYYQTNNNGKVEYYLNNEITRSVYLKYLSDNTSLYYSLCNMLPISERKSCDATNNWFAVTAQYLGSDDVRSCTEQYFSLPDAIRDVYLGSLLAGKERLSVVLSDNREKSTLSEPSGWGLDAKWPLFFFFMYFGLKLGQLVREFALSNDVDVMKSPTSDTRPKNS